MMFTMLKNKYVILACSLVLVLNPLQAFATEVDTSDPKTITNVQVVLNSMGYDCGGSAGVLDERTGDAIRRYQNDHGLNEDGVITDALLESLSSNESSLKIPGMSLENYINRYNSAVVNSSGNGVSSMNLLADISDSSLGYDLDNQSSVKLWINEGFGNSQDIVGKTRIKTQNSGSMSNAAKEEIVNCIYAIDTSLTTRAEADEIYNKIIQRNGPVSEDGILYELEINEEMISISAEYEGFVDTYSSFQCLDGPDLIAYTPQESANIASANNGSSQTNNNQQRMSLNIEHTMLENNSVGDEWSYVTLVNNAQTSLEYILSVGDKIDCYAKYIENDDNSEDGYASDSHVVTEEDLQSGFSVSLDVYVYENGGRYNGNRAHFNVIFNFNPI